MDDSQFQVFTANYQAFLKRVDTHILHVEEKYGNDIVCKKGCDACCRFLNLFPVEAFALSHAFAQLPVKEQKIIAANIEKEPDNCPLLIKNTCALYLNRPIICRTHGYPIYMETKTETYIDFCPENFKGFTSFPKDAIISIEQLNTTLTAINQHFLESIETDTLFPERIPVSTALFLLSDPFNIHIR